MRKPSQPFYCKERNKNMPEVVLVSKIDNMEKLRPFIEDHFKNKRYAEITQAIGIHSILIDSEHTIRDQAGLYRTVLNLLKDRINKGKGKSYGSWYAGFPKLMDELRSSKQVVTDTASQDMIASHCAAYGPFKSMDDFFFWALDDRRMTLEQIVNYIEKTTAMHSA